mmetsp:Transcript_14501/g.29950  ORF Transcript_14501/g.29950 Transcript_14501/m.29950 type:complete len:87 (+) Transcript_14501:1049-1309(+)
MHHASSGDSATSITSIDDEGSLLPSPPFSTEEANIFHIGTLEARVRSAILKSFSSVDANSVDRCVCGDGANCSALLTVSQKMSRFH